MCFKVDPSGTTLDDMLRQLEAPLAALADLAKRFSSAGFEQRDAGAVAPIVERLGELRYYRRFLDEVSSIEDELDGGRP